MIGQFGAHRSSAGPSPVDRRIDRLVLAQVHATLLSLLAGPCMLVAALRLNRVPGENLLWSILLIASGALAVAAGLAPWVSSRVTVRLQRMLLWSAIVVAGFGFVGSVLTVEIWSLAGMQAMVAAATLAELGIQRRAILHFWVTTIVLVSSVWLYFILVAVQPRIG